MQLYLTNLNERQSPVSLDQWLLLAQLLLLKLPQVKLHLFGELAVSGKYFYTRTHPNTC